MSKLVYLSNYSSIKTEEFYNSFLEKVKLNQEKEIYYILPNGRLINKYRERILKDLEGNFPLNLYTFDDIVMDLLSDRTRPIRDEFKLMIVSKIVGKLYEEGRLSYYEKLRDMDGFLHSLVDIIVALKRNLVRSSLVLKNIRQEKYREMALIYERYEKYLKDNDLLDREELYFRAIDGLKIGSLALSAKDIYIDEFYDFRPIEIKLLEILAGENINIYINITSQMSRDNRLINKTILSLKKLGFGIKEETYAVQGFNRLGYDLFSSQESELDLNLHAIVASSKYLEVRKVFEEIKRDLNNGVALDEICLLPLDDTYLEIIEAVNEQEKLAFNFSFNRSLIDFKLSREILGLLKLTTSENLGEALINRIHFKYFIDLDNKEKNMLVRLIKNTNILSISDLEEFLGRKEYELNAEEIPILNVLGDILSEIKELGKIDKLLGFNEYLKELFDKYNLKDQILALMDLDLESFSKEVEIYKLIDEILLEIENAASYLEKINLEGYIDLWEEFLKSTKIGLYERKNMGLRLLELIDSRGFEFKNVYILGMSKDLYPNIREENFFFQDRNMDLINSLGLEYKNYEVKLDNEVAKLSKLLSSTKEKLVISYSQGENNEAGSSLFFDDITSRVKDVKTNFIDFDFLFKEDLNSISNNRDYLNYILLNIDKDLSKLSMEIDESYLIDLNRALKPLVERQNLNSNFNGVLSKEANKAYISERYEDYKYSATSLETYSNCPFRFFMAYVLKLEEVYEEEAEDFLGLGNLYHRVLRDFYSNNYRDGLRLEDLDVLIDSLFKKYMKDLKLKNETRLEEIYWNDKRGKIRNFIAMDLERLDRNKIQPSKFEFSFGQDIDFKIGKTKLYGRIDRIDRLEDGIEIIDYKSSSATPFKEISKGLSLQMPIYFMSQAKLKPRAALYGLIEKAKYDVSFGVKDSVEEIKRKRDGKFEDMEDIQIFLEDIAGLINEIREQIIKANFIVDPKNCSDYCEFKNACSYIKVGV